MNPTEGSASNSGMSIILAPHAAYRATELVRQRKLKGEYDETLVKWVRQEPRSAKLTKDELKELERTCKEYLIWMRRDEMEACCPHLLASESTLNGPHPSTWSSSGDSTQANLEFEEEGSLREMAEDITQLVARAHKLMNRPTGAATVKMLSNTISILSAYAKIGSLSNTFRECGALDMLLKLLFSQQSEVRFAARDMLRSLTTYDLSSRSYVLLQLTKSNADPTSATTVQSRQTLLDLFVETASSDEGELLLRGITLPQVPGRFIFSLLMKYLKVTSASYVTNSPTPIPTIEMDSESIEFEQFYVRYQLITELFTCFSWFQGTLDEEVQRGTNRVLKGISIFTGTVPEELKQVKKKKNPYKTRDDFTTDREYGQYMKAALTPGMRIRARVNYESVTEGDYGVYRQTNDGTPPAQFSWDGLGGDTYWLYWHQVEILPPVSDQEDPKDVAMAAFRQPAIKQPYVMRSLALPPTNNPDQHRKETVSRPFWWEVLCMVRSIAAEKHMQRIIDLFDNVETFDDLVQLEPTYSQVASIVEYLETVFPHLAQEPLSIKEMSQFREVYNDETSKIFPAKEDGTRSAELDGPFNKEAPYPDPFDEEPHVNDHKPWQLRELDTIRFRNLRSRAGQWRDRREESDPIYDLRSLDFQQNGTVERLQASRELIEEMNRLFPNSVKVCALGLDAIRDGLGYLNLESNLQECCMTGMFTFILKMMELFPTSVHLQAVGIQSFFALMGGYGFDTTLPRPKVSPYERKSHRERDSPLDLSDATKQVIMATVVSLATAPQHGGINTVVKAVRVALTQYNLAMIEEVKKRTVLGVRDALCIFYILSQDEFTRNKMGEWGVPEVLDMCTDQFPDFDTKMDLVALVANALPSYKPPVNYSLREPTIEVIRAINNMVMAVVKALRRTEDIQTNDPIPRLLKLCHKDPTKCEYDFFLQASKPFANIFLFHHGVYYLSEAMQQNRSSRFTQDALTLIGTLIFVDRDIGAHLVLQGGLRALVFAMSANVGSKLIQIMCLQMLQELARDAENLCVMAAENVINPLKQCKDKYKDDAKLCGQLQELIDLCESEETSRAFLHQKILGIVFSGVLQTLLTNIEDARRERTLIHLPKFSGLIKYLSAGTGGTVSLGEKDQWWDRVEVSSNGHRKDRLVDGDPTTYWESAGRSGSHHIRFYMKKDLVVRKMYLHVSSRDSTYMPQRVTIHGGHSPNHVMDVSTVYIPSTYNGGYEILSNCKKFYNCISISIHRCQQGGIDTRIRGVTCQAARTSLWPLFGDLFSARSRLFYFIQVQMWLKESSLGPLELFDRLSSVVLYEQMFADSFLVTALARQCIGQACRSALIAPLIETMTQQATGSPDLSKLIRDYVTEMNPPLSSQWKLMVMPSSDLHTITGTELIPPSGANQFDFSKAQERLVYMSRVRRMCRLLVDCDDNTASKRFVQEDPDDYEIEIIGGDGEDGDNLLTPGSGTMSMAKCWRDLVQVEVTQVLKKFDLKYPHLVTTDLLTIYDKLKQAMLELFGGHSQFTLALKEGFSRAFQGLDEVTAVRCCELICLSIDSLMDSSGKGACRFHSVEENRKETMLLHFAEPLQFLHNLDIAHVFEHYYRRHLSARLLRGRSVSLTLERRLALAFAHCFPHKYPLQMLQDLDSSKALMDRFCDSELLESLDQLMVRATSQATVHISPEVVELAQKCAFYRMRHFQVYTLNPCFWPLRQRPMSVSVLPVPLSTFCDDYSRFFVAVHEYGLQQHERARRIHFTLYGWAVLVYNGVKLITSTVQMIILLQFNDRESHTLKSLHEVTHLPYEELCDALLSLTAERQCILVTSSQPYPPCVQSEDETSASPPVTPFTLSTLFIVNEAFSQCVLSKRKTNNVRFRDVRLVNRNHLPTLEDRTADLAHIFERRRAIMDSAIVRMLKREKEMSVDTIAVKVIKGCSDGKFDRGVTFGGFDCDYRDVCSRVDRLIMDGYIRRDESEQQLLIYVPDPDTVKTTREKLEAAVEESTSHPRITAPTQESAASKKVDKETKRSTSPSASSSKETISKSSPSPTERSGSLLPQKRLAEKVFGYSSKRKPPPFSRIYTTDWYNQDDAPLLGMLPTSRSLTTDEIQLQINSLLDSVCQTLEADRDTLEHLLFHCKWNKDTLIQKYLNSREDLLLEAGLTGENVASPTTKEQVSCSVCLTNMSSSELSELFCGHICCNSCWQKHIMSQIDLNKALQCSCPTYGCVARPTRSFIVKVLGDDTDEIRKYNKAVMRSYVEQSGWLTWCCNPQGCDQVLCKGDGLDTGTCSKCQWSSCFSCDFPEAHQPASCTNMQKWIEDGGFYVGMDEDAQSKQVASLIAKRCPGCNAQIEKNEGCLHMKCKCGHGFCWNCMKPWKPTHIDFFKCTAKKTQAARNHRKFADYNERCAVHEKSKAFAERLNHLVKGISDSVPIKILSFLSDACQLLVQCHKMLNYSCVAEYYTSEGAAYLDFLCDNLEGDTIALQAFLENTLLAQSDPAQGIRSISERTLLDGYRLVSKIENTRDKLMIGFHQQFKLGDLPTLEPPTEEGKAENQEEGTDEDELEFEVDVADELTYVYSDYDEPQQDQDSFDDTYADIFRF